LVWDHLRLTGFYRNQLLIRQELLLKEFYSLFQLYFQIKSISSAKFNTLHNRYW
jgi:hypothetical protein